MNALARPLAPAHRAPVQGSGPYTAGGGSRLVAVALLVFVAACASIAPGEDPVVVRAEQALAGSDAIYKDALAYWFAPGVAATLSPGVSRVFETVRTGFDPVYKDAQKALDTYKAAKVAVAAGKTGDPAAAQAALSEAVGKLGALVNQVLGQIPGAFQKRSAGKPVGGV